MKGLTGSAAIVTGAGRGIGRAIAIRLAEEGMSVGVNDIDRQSTADTVKHIEAAGGKAFALVGDVSAEADTRAMVAACVKQCGRLDLLVNNAGVDFSGSVQETDEAAWAKVQRVDLFGPFSLARAAESELAQRNGGVINIASTHAVATVPNRTTYAAAKAGVVGLTRALAVELGPKGIRVNAVLPGYIQTPIWKLWLDKAADPKALLAKIARRHPVRRLGVPEDVAGVVAFLASSDAAFITGTTVVVDGGYTAQLEPPE